MDWSEKQNFYDLLSFSVHLKIESSGSFLHENRHAPLSLQNVVLSLLSINTIFTC